MREALASAVNRGHYRPRAPPSCRLALGAWLVFSRGSRGISATGRGG